MEFDKWMNWVQETDSTNEWLKSRVDKMDGGTWCATTNQTAGKGRLGREWLCARGECLCLSVLEKCEAHPAATLLMGLVVTEVLKKMTGKEFTLKWPNDVLVLDKKVSGILCEGGVCETGPYMILGVGVNLLQTGATLSETKLPFATSVRRSLGISLYPDAVAKEIKNQWEINYDVFRTEGFAPFVKRYKAVSANLGKEVCVLSPDGEELVRGTASDIAMDGSLVIQTEADEYRCSGGEVSIRGIYGYGS